MAQFQVTLRSGPESNRFDYMFHAFVQPRTGALPEDALVVLESTPDGVFDRKTVTLWSEQAVHEFASSWARVTARVVNQSS